MPLYEYRCQGCGQTVEAIQKLSDPVLTTCEACGGILERLFSAPAIQFKGTGWYVTDYARSKNGHSAKSESKPAAETTTASSAPAPAKTKAD